MSLGAPVGVDVEGAADERFAEVVGVLGQFNRVRA